MSEDDNTVAVAMTDGDCSFHDVVVDADIVDSIAVDGLNIKLTVPVGGRVVVIRLLLMV